MKITKFEHACVVLEEQGKKLVIDPGGFTPEFGGLENVVAVVVTHEHGDHLDLEKLQEIAARNSDVQMFAPADAAAKMSSLPVIVSQDSQTVTVGPFRLEFYGQKHATIHPDFAVCDNTGVMVNYSFYYPGDSFVLPNKPVQVLATPVSAPWLKMQETIDFVRAVRPKICIPTHNGLLSPNGHKVADAWMTQICPPIGTDYQHPNPGDSIEV